MILALPSLIPNLAIVVGLTHRVCEMLEVLHEVCFCVKLDVNQCASIYSGLLNG